jgi:hypothetical protein
MKFLLLNKKTNDAVGEMVMLSNDNCYYHLFDSMSFTRQATLEYLEKKYRLQAL